MMVTIKHEMVQLTPSLPFKFYAKDPHKTAIAPHWHRGLELNWLVAGGPLTVVQNGVTSIFHAGAMWTVDSRVVHASQSGGVPVQEYGIIIDPTFLESVLPDSVNWHFTLQGPPEPQSPAYAALQAAFAALPKPMTAPLTPVSRLEALSAFYQMLALLATHFTAVKATPVVRVNAPLVDEAMALIDQQYAEPVKISQLAAQLHTLVTTLGNQFQATLKQSPNQYLQEVRLMKARELLLTSNKPIEYVAMASGFGNSRSLARNFKRWKGLTPSAYRAAYKRYHQNDRIYFEN